VCLEVEDDGRGMDLRTRDPVQAGLGLFSARAVLALAGGELQISSAPGLGTRVVARVPVTEAGAPS
jgi:signal transduction histidine kinase